MNGGEVTNLDQRVIIADSGVAGDKSVLRITGGILAANTILEVGFGASGTLIVDGGEVDVSRGEVRFCGDARSKAGDDSAVVLSNGVLKAQSITYGAGAAQAELLFDGGTLQAAGVTSGASFLAEHANLAVAVGEAGGTIDANGFDITISEPLTVAAGVAVPGALKLSGGSTITFAGAVACPVVAEAGTAAGVTAASKSSVLPRLTIAIPAAGIPDGTLAVAGATGTGLFSQADLEAVSLTGDQDGRYVLALADGGASIKIADTLVGEYVWNDGASGADWRAAGKWTANNAAVDWRDSMIAVFENSGDNATLGSAAAAAELIFYADATVGGTGTLTVPSVAVAADVSATVAAPTAGPLTKTGPGALTLGATRPDATALSEGTLKMAAGATVIPANLTLGTDSAKPVVFDYGAQTLTANPTAYIGPGMDVTLTNGTFTYGADIVFADSTIPSVLTVAKDAVLQTSTRFSLNAPSSAATIKIAGGQIKALADSYNWIMQASLDGRLNINVTDGGLLEFGGRAYMLTCRDEVGGSTAYQNLSLHLCIVDSTLRVKNNNNLFFGNDTNNKNPAAPDGVFAATNSTIDIAGNLFIGHNVAGTNKDGAYTADFENCTITAKSINVYHDRPLNAVRFNSTKFVLSAAAADSSLFSSEEFETMGEGGTAIKPITIDAGGLTIDTNGKNGIVLADPQGPGAITKTGEGILYIRRDLTSASPLVCAGGETYVTNGLTIARATTVRGGAKLTVRGAGRTEFAGGIALESGSELHIDGYALGVAPVATAALALPESSAANLSKDGAFTQGKYKILEMPGITAAEVDGKLVPLNVAPGLAHSWSVEDDTLYLTMGLPSAFTWTGLAGDNRLSTPGNWFGGAIPGAGDPVDFSAIGVDTTLIADIDAKFGAVAMGTGVITFNGSLAAASFTDTSKIAVAADSTVTLDGNLVLDTATEDKWVVYKVDAGGVFKVTGTITGTGSKSVFPAVVTCEGAIAASGLVADATSDGWMFRLSRNGGHIGKWIIGSDGIDCLHGNGYWVFNTANDHTEIQAYADFTIRGGWIGLGKSTPAFTILTSSPDGAARTITAQTGFVSNSGGTGNFEILGAGTFLCDYVPTKIATHNAFSGAITVKDTATLAVNPGKYPTTGKTTVQSGATYKVAGSGVVALGSALELASGATLGFNVTRGATLPVLDLAGKTATLPAAIMVKLEGICPSSNLGNPVVLTSSGGMFAGTTVSLADPPRWAKSVEVDENGEIAVTVRRSMTVILR